MTLDLIIRDARLSDGAAPVDIGIAQGRIATIATGLAGDAPSLDAEGGLIFRGFADSHLHLDKACILERAVNRTGDLQGALAAVAAAKKAFTTEDVYARGARVLEQAIGQGTTLIRTQVEIDPVIGLAGFEAVKQLKKGLFLGAGPADLRLPSRGAAELPGHRGAVARGAGGGRRPARRLPLYRHRPRRSDRPALRDGA
ncbi:hypothetical protein [Alloyangia mangrovi]|uniref:hypothetical protein n=1 Tax=Alloyangia mangrovi TaxID=1779329 RepID=UPI0021A5A4BA|nr:hypothetical protein [Alloyangia mangrovi]